MITTYGWIQPVDSHFSASGLVDLISVSCCSNPAVCSICSVYWALNLFLLLAQFPLGCIHLQLHVMEKPFYTLSIRGLRGSPGLPQSQLRESRAWVGPSQGPQQKSFWEMLASGMQCLKSHVHYSPHLPACHVTLRTTAVLFPLLWPVLLLESGAMLTSEIMELDELK